jgi:hypothetical protein
VGGGDAGVEDHAAREYVVRRRRRIHESQVLGTGVPAVRSPTA